MCLNCHTHRLFCVLLAGEEPHDVPVTRENTEFHQISEHTQDLQQELLEDDDEEDDDDDDEDDEDDDDDDDEDDDDGGGEVRVSVSQTSFKTS